jgi:tetratricopeptide (TPR) repeat protein
MTVTTVPRMELDGAAWVHRDKRFVELTDRGDFVGMYSKSPLTHEMRAAWIAIPRHGNLLDAVAHARDHDTIVRYAAINWRKRTLRLDEPDFHAIAASYGAQLADAFDHLLHTVDASRRQFFLQPYAYIDLDNQVRVGFESGASMRAPELKLDERAFVYVVGRLWMTLLEDVPHDGVGALVRRCIDISPRKRFRSLEKLMYACLDKSGGRDRRDGERLRAWYVLETALGYRALGNLDRARDWFRCAIAYAEYRSFARKGLLDVEEPYEIEIDIPPMQLPQQAAPLPAPPRPPPTPARASYLEGRALLLQRKLHEAQVCFASAILLDPMMLEAQLLRREVDRMLGRIRATTGMPTSMPIDVPASLREVREIVLGGRIRDAIAVLSTDAYANNVDAPLFRARLLALDGQYDRAASTFASITDGPHVDEARLGLARVTIDRGKAEAALAILDEILTTRPRDLGALEARARCLELLGRTDEASEAMKAFVAAVELASDVRLARAT